METIKTMILAAAMAVGTTFFVAGFSATPASGQAGLMCGPRSELIITLARDFNERPSAMGLTSNGGVMELFSSPAGSWTLVVTFAPDTSSGGGKTCLIATGEGWQPVEPTPLGTSM